MPDRLWSGRLLVGFTVALVLTGVVMVYSASSIMAEERFRDTFFFLKRHLIYALIGISIMLIVARVDYIYIKYIAFPLLVFTFSLLIFLLIPGIGTEVGGATRWLRFGPLSFQPSELAKLAIIFFSAYSISRKHEDMKDFKKGFLSYITVLMLFIVPILLQPDFGTAITITGIVMIMLFVAGTRVSFLALFSMFVAMASYILITGSEYRLKRILSFLDPWSDPLNTGHQIIQSFLAFGSGGMLGRGLGEGRQKLFYLPEPHTDFILSVVGEELGFIGVTAIILIFASLVIIGIRAALKARERFGTYLAIGITSMISLQATVNMGVVMGLLPTKGLTLPFVSYGGTSLVSNMIGVGILASITARGES